MDLRTGLAAIRSMDFVILLADDMEKMTAFYRDVLGLELEELTAGAWAGFRVGTLYLGLRPRGRSYDGEPIPDTSAGAQISFRLPPADVDIAYAELIAKGVQVIEKPTNQDWPHRTMFLHDPEHNIIEIYADIHPDDTLPAPSGVHQTQPR